MLLSPSLTASNMEFKQNKGKNRNRVLLLIGLQLAVLMFASSGIFTKLASAQEFLSVRFLLLYGVAILIMFAYAVLWQQFLKYIPLTTAYASKSVSTVWTMLFGFLVFRETVTVSMMIGAAIIIVGVFIVVTADE